MFHPKSNSLTVSENTQICFILRFILLFCEKNDSCAYYRGAEPIVYARGFTCMQKRMLPDQYDKFLWKLIPHFGRNPYYERRSGRRLLSPDEQELIAEVARQVGVTEEFKFDKYEYRYPWKD